jgi:glyoxylase-like metal-dependent hydrolase (beta-lactamase superfamily II)
MSQFNRTPLVQPALAREIAPGVIMLPDQHIDLVPDIGIVIGTDAVLVVDCGMGIENGKRVLHKAREVAGEKPLLLTSTHFHPEHAFGAQAFKGQATIITNTTQANELREKGAFYLALFRDLGPEIRELLEDVEVVMPDETYEGERVIDLGGKRVVLRELAGHTRGDQIIFLPDAQVLFTGDLVENRLFPIFPDQDAHGKQWIEALGHMIRLAPVTVVPGHGEVGTVNLLQEFQDYLIFVREEVGRRANQGQALELIEQEGTRIIKERYPQWGNDRWIPFEIRSFYAEVTGKALTLPTF